MVYLFWLRFQRLYHFVITDATMYLVWVESRRILPMDWATMFGTVGASGMFLPSQLCSLTSSLVSVPTDPLWTPWSGRAAAGRERLSRQLLQGGQDCRRDPLEAKLASPSAPAMPHTWDFVSSPVGIMRTKKWWYNFLNVLNYLFSSNPY